MLKSLLPLLSLLLAVAAPLRAASTADALAALEARVAAENTYPHIDPAFHRDVLKLIESNAATTGEEFRRLSQIAAPPVSDYRSSRVRYELTLAAVASGATSAETDLAAWWDDLLGNLGRPMRFDAFGWLAQNPDNDRFTLDPAPKAIAFVWRQAAAARTAAAAAKDNPEVQRLVDEDQAARQNWGAHSPEELKQIDLADHARNRRIREILAAGDLHTAKDFANASLVLQHSSTFAGYQLAHELAVGALLLGDRGLGRWLVAATYDRMLHSVGHLQRFGTQGKITFGNEKPTVADTDEAGICDQERLALGCPTLAAKRADFYTRKPST